MKDSKSNVVQGGKNRKETVGLESVPFQMKAMLAVLVLCGVGLMAIGIPSVISGSSIIAPPALDIISVKPTPSPDPEPEPPKTAPLVSTPVEKIEAEPVTLYQSDLHPALLHGPHIPVTLPSAGQVGANDKFQSFHELLDLYAVRQGVDDNMTIRVLDDRNGEVLEVVRLDMRDEFLDDDGEMDWSAVDRIRGMTTRELSKKYQARGVPKGNIVVRWGRAQQVQEARKRDLPFIQHEMRMAEMLGLSLLATEIGTVETFNQDWMVSRAGARSRYQIMPDHLKSFGIRSDKLRTLDGSEVAFREERHPILAMDASFAILLGFVNAVGHEIPGISAYHTGPNNLLKIYSRYLNNESANLSGDETVLDAFVWGLTEGFEDIRKRSTFRSQSRAYFPSVYGSLRAVEHDPIDYTGTMESEMMIVQKGTKIALSKVLETLRTELGTQNWSFASTAASDYERFRMFNPHIELETADGDSVPPSSDILFGLDGTRGLRVFLPPGSSNVLRDADVGVFDYDQTRVIDADSYSRSDARMEADEEYAKLVESVADFGFTNANRAKLGVLKNRMIELARKRPTRFRKIQAEAIKLHSMMWSTSAWKQLASTVRSEFRGLASSSPSSDSQTVTTDG